MQLCKLPYLQRSDHKFRILEPHKVPPWTWKWCSFEEECWWWPPQEYASTTPQIANLILITTWLPKSISQAVRRHGFRDASDDVPHFLSYGALCTNIAVQKDKSSWHDHHMCASWTHSCRKLWSLSCLNSQWNVGLSTLAAFFTTTPNQFNL